MITVSYVDLLYFLSRLKSRFKNSRFQTSNLNPIKSENMTFIKKNPQSSVLSYQRCILFGISEVASRLLLIAVIFYTSQDIYHLISWLQISAEGSDLEHIYPCNCSCSFALLCPRKLCSGFLPPSHRSNHPYGRRGQPRQARGGGGSEGEPTDEPAPPPYEVRSTSSAYGNELF